MVALSTKTVGEDIAWLRYRNNEIGSEEYLDIYNALQQEVYGQDCDQSIKLDPTTGMPPFLSTVDATYEYDCPTDCRKTIAVFCETPNDQARNEYSYGYDSYQYGDTKYKLLPVMQEDARPGSLAKLTFINKYNPGTTSEKYYHYYYKLPEAITDAGDYLMFPVRLHRKIRLAILAMVKSEQYGSLQEEQIIQSVAQDIRNQMNGGSQAHVYQTPVRIPHRHFGNRSERLYR